MREQRTIVVIKCAFWACFSVQTDEGSDYGIISPYNHPNWKTVHVFLKNDKREGKIYKRNYLIFCMLGNFSCFCCHLMTFIQINFQKILSESLSECQTIWIQVRSGLTQCRS